MIRPARPTDSTAFAALGRARSASLSNTLVAERDGRVDGYVQFHALGAIGYVRDLVVAEPARASDLMLAAAAALRDAGVREWHLNARLGDEPAPELYERLGMRAEHHSIALRLPWARLDELPRRPATALPVSAEEEEDDDLERALGMITGQIAMARRRATQVLVQLRGEDCEPLGFAAFDPRFPGARIFRVAHPAYAGPLLDALRRHAHHDEIALVVDDDEALAELLVACGAR